MTEQELQAIEQRANAATSTGLAKTGPWVSLADVPALVAEVRRLRALVEAAYREGAVAVDPHGADDAKWEESDARKALGDV